MTLGLELFGMFLFGVGFTLVGLAVAVPRLGPRLIRWQMKKTLVAVGKTSEGKPVSIHRVDG